MFKKMKRLLAYLLTVCMLVSMMPVTVYAEEGEECSHDWNNGMCSICYVECFHDRVECTETCRICGQSGNDCHEWGTNGICQVCSFPCDHMEHWSGGMCTVCNFVCSHEDSNGEKTWDSVYGKCNTCGFECSHYSDMKSTFDSETGKCTICGMKNPCEHPKESQTLLETGRLYDNDATYDNQDGTHAAKYRNYAKYNCGDCSLSYTVYEDWIEIKNEQHIWNYSDGMCDVCGAENRCEHPNLSENEVIKRNSFSAFDSVWHETVGAVYDQYVCSDCGMNSLEYKEEYSQYEVHEFSNSICNLCGKECEHNDGWTNGYCNICEAECNHIYDWYVGGCRVCEIAMEIPVDLYATAGTPFPVSNTCNNYVFFQTSEEGTYKVTATGDDDWEFNVYTVDESTELGYATNMEGEPDAESSTLFYAEAGVSYVVVCRNINDNAAEFSILITKQNIQCTEHNWKDGICQVCYKICKHTYQDVSGSDSRVCSVCGVTCVHDCETPKSYLTIVDGTHVEECEACGKRTVKSCEYYLQNYDEPLYCRYCEAAMQAIEINPGETGTTVSVGQYSFFKFVPTANAVYAVKAQHSCMPEIKVIAWNGEQLLYATANEGGVCDIEIYMFADETYYLILIAPEGEYDSTAIKVTVMQTDHTCQHDFILYEDMQSAWCKYCNANCEHDSWNNGICTVCGIECKHTEVTDEAVAENCTDDGLTEGKHCSVCHKVLTAQETVPATGHTDENNDNKCDNCNKSAFIVAGSMYTETGTEVSGNMTGLNKYYENDEAKIVAPAVSGYNFVGWYAYDASAANKCTGENLCTSRNYRFAVTADTNLVAVYKALGSAEISIDGGSSFSINGENKSEESVISYPLGSHITVICNSDAFEYWKNSAGMVLSRNKTYTFTVTGKETVNAVLNTVIDNKATVVFESYYGQIISRDQYATGAKLITAPGLPYRYGYTAVGWDYDGNGTYNAEADTFSAALSRAFLAEKKIITIRPVYQLVNVEYTITVENGTGSGKYNQNDKVTVTANPAETGYKFSHWQDGNGTVLSYKQSYQFFAAKNITVTAVYVAEATKVEAKGTTEIIDNSKDSANNKLIFVSMSTVPEGCTINMAGIVATNNAEKSSNLTSENADYVRGNAWTGDAYRYTWTKGNVQSGQTWYVRAYLVYTDAEGNTHTVYGDMVSQTM